MKKALKTAPRGTAFNYAGQRWVVLEHNATDTLLQTEGVQPAKAASQIAKLMQPGPVLMIAHNAQFDACFLRGLLRGAKVGRINMMQRSS